MATTSVAALRMQLEEREGRTENICRIAFFCAVVVGVFSCMGGDDARNLGNSDNSISASSSGYGSTSGSVSSTTVLPWSFSSPQPATDADLAAMAGVANFNLYENRYENDPYEATGGVYPGKVHVASLSGHRYQPQQGVFAVNPSVLIIVVGIFWLMYSCISKPNSSSEQGQVNPLVVAIGHQSDGANNNGTSTTVGGNMNKNINFMGFQTGGSSSSSAPGTERFGTITGVANNTLFGKTQGNVVDLQLGEGYASTMGGIGEGRNDQGPNEMLIEYEDHIGAPKSRFPKLQRPLSSKTPSLDDATVRQMFPAVSIISAALHQMIHGSVIPPLLVQVSQSDELWMNALSKLNLTLTTEFLSSRGFDRTNQSVVSVFDRNLPIEVTSKDPTSISHWKKRQELELFLLHPQFQPGLCRQYIYNRLTLFFQTGKNFLLGDNYANGLYSSIGTTGNMLGGGLGTGQSNFSFANMLGSITGNFGNFTFGNTTSNLSNLTVNKLNQNPPDNFVHPESGISDFHILENLLLKTFETHLPSFSSTYLAPAAQGSALLRSLNPTNGGWVGYEVIARDATYRLRNVLDAFALFLLLKRGSRDFSMFPLPITNMVNYALNQGIMGTGMMQY